MRYAIFNYIGELAIPLKVARSCSHPGECSKDVEKAIKLPAIRKELDKIDRELLRCELKAYGAWTKEDLQDHETNLQRVLWLASGQIMEDIAERRRKK